MDCDHYDAGRCRSCSWLPRPYDDQVAALQARSEALLQTPAGLVWEVPFRGPEQAFRNKAKMVVTGTADAPRLGILGESGAGVDLRDCGLYVPAITDALPVVAEFVTRAKLPPYDVAARRGELKLVILTAAPTGRLMLRFVARSQEPVTRIRKHLPWLLETLPGLLVVSVNLQPEHKAVLEGADEILLTEADALPMPVNDVHLQLRTRSFFQTNTTVAAALYRDARSWVADLGTEAVWDLYCGVGGFALHLAGPGRRVIGVESSAEAIRSAQESAVDAGAAAEFVVADATAYALDSPPPDLVVVNPPRRGIGTELTDWLEASTVRQVLYSSCNPESLARDLARMPSLVPRRARLFDMFPHTEHVEVLTLLERTGR
ncbi:23S rRNA (uracil(747)-C(5))-methyltransferase RlmC [Nocardioides marmoriginsengisoli]|uniref:23S rRNA (Uracil(747)-C(5))-methyltransferase RlmC n=1 Tax=Nocardioides marmoriginsengisoli TaxID=661483 RepID=A0A3N0CL47_9ACTN|nr:23S rRNA (uracil(747)-C(5))-methyltransferase RlmC [Nocardioides marmoriginsengisoli]RNL64069.1 23S rRNA (uracil(747)-C(5))-methyltransferase RlmC [Nocardioides marmoriginsengisoli]